MRLIDADALGKTDRPVGKLMMFGGEYVYTQTEIDRAPTIDAVPVVRCRECIHRKKCQDDEQEGDTICTLEWKIKKLDWFCADGQRREDGEGDG